MLAKSLIMHFGMRNICNAISKCQLIHLGMHLVKHQKKPKSKSASSLAH